MNLIWKGILIVALIFINFGCHKAPINNIEKDLSGKWQIVYETNNNETIIQNAMFYQQSVNCGEIHFMDSDKFGFYSFHGKALTIELNSVIEGKKFIEYMHTLIISNYCFNGVINIYGNNTRKSYIIRFRRIG